MQETSETHIELKKLCSSTSEQTYMASVVSKRNDPKVNEQQRIQLQAWQANCDIQLIIDHHAWQNIPQKVKKCQLL